MAAESRQTPREAVDGIFKEGRLPAGYKIIFPTIDVIGGSIETHIQAGLKVDDRLLIALGNEYDAMLNLLKKVVGEENVRLIQSRIVYTQMTPQGPVLRGATLPKMPESMKGEEFPYIDWKFRQWPRDSYSLIDGQIHADPVMWNGKGDIVVDSPFFEGGKVLQRKNVLLVTPDVYGKYKKRKDIVPGKTVLPIPFVEVKLPMAVAKDHIDGHVALLEGKDGELGIFAAESYAKQGNQTSKKLRSVAQRIGARFVEIDDARLPLLAFNFIQLWDNSIVMSGGTGELEFRLKDFVGEDKIFTTNPPIGFTPILAGGSIRCLTNIIPPLDGLQIAA